MGECRRGAGEETGQTLPTTWWSTHVAGLGRPCNDVQLVYPHHPRLTLDVAHRGDLQLQLPNVSCEVEHQWKSEASKWWYVYVNFLIFMKHMSGPFGNAYRKFCASQILIVNVELNL